MSNVDESQLRELAGRATAGERTISENDGAIIAVRPGDGENDVHIGYVDFSDADFQFTLAMTPDVVLSLLSSLDEARRERDEWRTQHQNLVYVRSADLTAVAARAEKAEAERDEAIRELDHCTAIAAEYGCLVSNEPHDAIRKMGHRIDDNAKVKEWASDVKMAAKFAAERDDARREVERLRTLLDDALANCRCTLAERMSGHHVDCDAPRIAHEAAAIRTESQGGEK